MGGIVISEFVSLDGVIQDPDGKEGFRVGGWVGQIKDLEERTVTGCVPDRAVSVGIRYCWFMMSYPRRSLLGGLGVRGLRSV
jgi:hypothetical protein